MQYYLKVLVVFLIILVKLVEILRQLLGAPELVHMNVRVGGRVPGVVLRSGAHHYRQHIVSEEEKFVKICKFVSHQDSPEAVDKEFLRDVVSTV